MSALEFLCQILNVAPQKFTKEENILLDAELFRYTYEHLEKIFKEENKNYLRLLKSNMDRDNEMQEDNLIYCIINDILKTQEYTLEGIALYTEIPEDVIQEASIGINKSPSANLLRKVIGLHRTVRPELYREILVKLALEYLALYQKEMSGL